MKRSTYNLLIPTENNEVVWFNTLTHSYFRLSGHLSSKIKAILQEEEFELLPNDFLEKLKQLGFVVPRETDELEIVRECHKFASNSPAYTLQILPTLNCNYKCWYCIQDHIPTMMSEEVMDTIMNHLRVKIDTENIPSLRIEWFGGEPLMFFPQVVLPLSKRIKALCEEKNIPFSQGVTSNAYYLTPEVCELLDEYHVVHFQITLDGNRENHDKVKFQKGLDSAFDRALSSIVSAIRASENVSVTLRINYTYESMDERIVGEVCERIPRELRDRIRIFPRKVWQETPDSDKRDNYEEIWDDFEANGFIVKRQALCLDYHSCYINNRNYVTVNYNGAVLKCTACDDMYEPEGLGKITPEGKIEWHDSRGTDYDKPTFEKEECLNCIYLPICMGTCPRNMVQGKEVCHKEVSDMSFEYEILAYIKEVEMLRNRCRCKEDK